MSYYGNRLDSALSVAKDVYNLKSNEAQIVAAYSDAKNLSEEISQLPHNQVNTKDIITLPYDKNAPAAGQYNYQINQVQASNLSQALAAMSNNPFNSSSDIWTYGVGSDLLVNFINDSVTKKNNKLSVGLFGGIQLTAWLNSQYVNLTAFNNPYSAKVNTSNFQFLFNLGLRMNLATAKKKDSEHSAQLA